MPIWMCPFTLQPPFITILNGTFIYRFLSYQYVCVWSVWWRVKVTNEFDSITTPLQSLHIIYTSMSVQRTTVFSYFSFSIWMYGICRAAIVLIRHIQQPNQPAMSNSISIFFVVFVPVVFVVAQQSIQLIWFGVGRLFWQPSQADRIGFGKRHGSMLHLLPSLSTPALYITQTHIAHTAHTCTEETAVSNWILCFSAIFFFDSVSHKFVQRRMLHCEVVDGRRWYTCTLWASFFVVLVRLTHFVAV